MREVLATAAAVIYCVLSASHMVQTHASVTLEIDVTLYDQLLYNNTSVQYFLHDAQVGASYEVRVSYPASLPTDFVIQVFQDENMETYHGRKLLNVEQLHFMAQSKSYVIDIRAYRTGVSYDSNLPSHPVRFNVVVNR